MLELFFGSVAQKSRAQMFRNRRDSRVAKLLQKVTGAIDILFFNEKIKVIAFTEGGVPPQLLRQCRSLIRNDRNALLGKGANDASSFIHEREAAKQVRVKGSAKLFLGRALPLRSKGALQNPLRGDRQDAVMFRGRDELFPIEIEECGLNRCPGGGGVHQRRP